MSKRNDKIRKKIDVAIKRGDLISHEKVWEKFSKQEKEEIMRRTRYLMAAIELREARQRFKLTQAKLAKKIGAKREFVSRLESGRQNITLETFYRIGEAMGKTVEVRFR